MNLFFTGSDTESKADDKPKNKDAEPRSINDKSEKSDREVKKPKAGPRSKVRFSL